MKLKMESFESSWQIIDRTSMPLQGQELDLSRELRSHVPKLQLNKTKQKSLDSPGDLHAPCSRPTRETMAPPSRETLLIMESTCVHIRVKLYIVSCSLFLKKKKCNNRSLQVSIYKNF